MRRDFSIFLFASIVALVAMAIWAPNAGAYPQWSGSPSGECVSCHGGFLDNGYVSRTSQDGVPWNIGGVSSLHNIHRDFMLPGGRPDCTSCHILVDGTPAGTDNPLLASSGGGATGNRTHSCIGCHGRAEDQAGGQFTGAGLRQHHTNAGAAFCGGCHADDHDPSTFTTVGEDIPPPNYTDTDISLLGWDPCIVDVENPIFPTFPIIGALGLDNDGDLSYDQNDTDCGAVNTPPVAVDDLPGGAAITTTPLNTAVDIDVLANDTDADNVPPALPSDGLTVNSFDLDSANGTSNVDCSLTAIAGVPQCTYTPPLDFCGSDSFTYDVTDGIDPSANRATVTIDVGDANPPVVTAPTPDPLVITVPAGTPSVPATDLTIAAWLDSATANDAEDGDVTASITNNAPADFPLGDTPVTFTATDSCGNTSSATATVSVVSADNNVPVVTAPTPDPLLVTAPLCETSVPQTATADNFTGTIAEWLATATADDVEDGDVTASITNNAPDPFPLGDTPVTFTATDSLGAPGTASATVSVDETVNTAPVVTPPTPDPLVITVPAGTTSVPATDPQIAAWLDSATANDAEDGDVTASITNNAPTDFPLGTTTVTFTATDSCGLQGTATAQVIIQEEAGNTPPVVTVPDPLTVTAELCAVSVPATDPEIAAWLASATATDAEDGTLPVSNDAPADFPAAMAPGATTTVNFSATDSGELTTTVPSTATVIDPNTAPVVTAPAPLTLTVPAGTTSVPATDPQIAAWLASATATDAEDGPLGVMNDAPADFPLGTTTVTFTATDSCNVMDTATSTVTIQEEGAAVEAEVDAPGAINGRSQGRTPIQIGFDDGMPVEIAELFCGGNVSNAGATPERINAEDGEEFTALFRTRDLELVCAHTEIVCKGTLADGRSFEGMDEIRVIRDVDGDRCK